MPSISNKGLSMPESPIRKLVPFAELAKKNNVEVLHLNIGQPDIKPPDAVLNKIKNFNISTIEYTHSAGIESYRKGIAKYYNDLGISNISHENINSHIQKGDELAICLQDELYNIMWKCCGVVKEKEKLNI